MFIAQFRLKAAVQKLLCEFQEILDFSSDHPVRAMRKIAQRETVDYIRARMGDAIGVYTARDVFDVTVKSLPVEGHLMEFGVFRGGTIRYLASRVPHRQLHGFDSFQGLPETWSGYNLEKSAFSVQGKLPQVPDNVKLYAGWFDETLPKWLERNDGPVAFVHVDCDLYSSTKIILDLLGARFRVGTVIVFDEYFGYPNWQRHEFKAFKEFVEANNIQYEYVAYSRFQAAVRLLAVGKHE